MLSRPAKEILPFAPQLRLGMAFLFFLALSAGLIAQVQASINLEASPCDDCPCDDDQNEDNGEPHDDEDCSDKCSDLCASCDCCPSVASMGFLNTRDILTTSLKISDAIQSSPSPPGDGIGPSLFRPPISQIG